MITVVRQFINLIVRWLCQTATKFDGPSQPMSALLNLPIPACNTWNNFFCITILSLYPHQPLFYPKHFIIIYCWMNINIFFYTIQNNLKIISLLSQLEAYNKKLVFLDYSVSQRFKTSCRCSSYCKSVFYVMTNRIVYTILILSCFLAFLVIMWSL